MFAVRPYRRRPRAKEVVVRDCGDALGLTRAHRERVFITCFLGRGRLASADATKTRGWRCW